MAKKEAKSTDWSKGKSSLSADERSTRGANITPKGAEAFKETSLINKYKASLGDAQLRSSFGAFHNASADDYTKALQRSRVSGEKVPVNDRAASNFMKKYGQDPRLAQGSFIESAENISNLKEFEKDKNLRANKKGLKGAKFGFDGGYGKGRVRAGVSSDMDSKNEEALGNSGLMS